MICPKCNIELPDEAICCWKCGRKMIRKTRRRSQRPKGTGTIVKMPGKRARPFAAYLPADYSSGKVDRLLLGSFETYTAAEAALDAATHAKNPKAHITTLEDLYNEFCATPYYKGLSDSGRQSHTTAWQRLKVHASVPVAEYKTAHIQSVIDSLAEAGKSKSLVNKVRNLASLLCKQAMKNDLMDKNYERLTDLDGKDTKESVPFTDFQMMALWRHRELKTVKAILVMCYTGQRPGEALSARVERIVLGEFNYLRSGSKTDAGRGKDGAGRIIPLPIEILDIVNELIDGRSEGPLITSSTGIPCDLNNWRKREFYPTLAKLGIQAIPDKEHPAILTPNSCRHTFYTNMRRGGADLEILAEIMGHEDVETGLENYNHYTADDIKRICTQANKFPKYKTGG